MRWLFFAAVGGVAILGAIVAVARACSRGTDREVRTAETSAGSGDTPAARAA